MRNWGLKLRSGTGIILASSSWVPGAHMDCSLCIRPCKCDQPPSTTPHTRRLQSHRDHTNRGLLQAELHAGCRSSSPGVHSYDQPSARSVLQGTPSASSWPGFGRLRTAVCSRVAPEPSLPTSLSQPGHSCSTAGASLQPVRLGSFLPRGCSRGAGVQVWSEEANKRSWEDRAVGTRAAEQALHNDKLLTAAAEGVKLQVGLLAWT